MARTPKTAAPKAVETPTEEDQVPQTTAIVNWDEELANMAKMAAGMEANTGSGGQFFSLKSGILSFNDQPMPNNEMAVVILDSIMENAFYEGAYDADEIVPPTCFAFGRDDATLTPHAAVKEIGQDQHVQCKGCPMNEFNTAEVGRGKACKNKRRLAIIPAGELDRNGNFTAFEDADQFAKYPIAYMKLPTFSVVGGKGIPGYAAYVKGLQGTLNRPPLAVFTKVKVVPDPKSQFRVLFEVIEPVPNKLLPVLMKRNKEAIASIEAPYDMTPREPASNEKPVAKGKAASAKAAEKPTKNVRPPVKKSTKNY